jgi:hypothetical protein
MKAGHDAVGGVVPLHGSGSALSWIRILMGGGGQVEAPENMKAGHDAVGGVVPHLHQPFRNLEQDVWLEG